MSKRQIFIIVFSVVLITAVIVLGVSLRFKGEEPDSGIPLAEDTEGDSVGAEEPGRIPEFSKEVDEKEEETKADEVIEVVTDPEKEEALGGYTITADRKGYSPDVLTVTQGNIVRLTLKAEDGKYDFSIPAMSIHISAPEGGEKQTSFRVPQSGTFRFECRDFCPSGGAIYGQLIVKPKN